VERSGILYSLSLSLSSFKFMLERDGEEESKRVIVVPRVFLSLPTCCSRIFLTNKGTAIGRDSPLLTVSSLPPGSHTRFLRRPGDKKETIMLPLISS
jgi:hypothetical protein